MQPIYQKSLMTLTQAHISFHNLLYHPCSLQLFLHVLWNTSMPTKCLPESVSPGPPHFWGGSLVEIWASWYICHARQYFLCPVLWALLHDSNRWFPTLTWFANLKEEKKMKVLLLSFHFSYWQKVRLGGRERSREHVWTAVKNDRTSIHTSFYVKGMVDEAFSPMIQLVSIS